jgi:quercetin dioxygenase-like cupin family protein
MAEINKLIDSIEYQKNSVVSKTIIKQDKGNVTIFAFDQGQALSEHTAPFDALVYIIDGVANIIIAGKDHLLKQGNMIIMPANKAHSLHAIKNFKMMLVMIKS